MTLSRTQTEPSEQCLWVDAGPVNAEELDEEEIEWFESLLRRASNLTSDVDSSHYIRDALAGHCALWSIDTEDGVRVGAMTTRVVQFETGYTVLTIQLCAVEPGLPRIPNECIESILKRIERSAALIGCDAVRIPGRPGKDWGEVASGYVEVERTFDKVLRGGSDG